MLTGATGFLRSSFFINVLESGYEAHIVVRSKAKPKTLQETPAIIALGKGCGLQILGRPGSGAAERTG